MESMWEKERSEDLAQEKDAEVGSRAIAMKKQEETRRENVVVFTDLQTSKY